jgi:serpin B
VRRLAGLFAIVVGCADAEPAPAPSPPTASEVAPPEEPITAPAADRHAVNAGNLRFAVDLYKQLAGKPGRLVIAPASVSEALAMTYAGAAGETAAEMAKALHFTLPPDRLHAAFGAARQELNAAAGPFELSAANALFGAGGFRPRPEFEALTSRFYAAGFRPLPLDREAATREVNGWVAEQTRDKIPELLKPGDIDPLTRLLLGNAVYFRGDWLHPFHPARTKPETFAVSPDRSVEVPMMTQTGITLDRASGPGFDLLELPYAGDRLAMGVLLPTQRHGLAAVEAGLTADALQKAFADLRPTECDIWLPRFTARAREELREPLLALGMVRAFSPIQAEFPLIGGNLYVKGVIHGGLIEVDERGSTAAGATVVTMNGRGARPPPMPFRADHPFLFLIRDRPTGAVLFLGRFGGPA